MFKQQSTNGKKVKTTKTELRKEQLLAIQRKLEKKRIKKLKQAA